jgi:Tol biopolymer transport system component
VKEAEVLEFRRTRGAAVAVAIALMALLAAPAYATFPGANGKIAYEKSGSSCLQLISADGTGAVEPGACDFDVFGDMVISPDGRRVAGAVYDPIDDIYDVRHSNLDGSDPVTLPGWHYTVPDTRWSHDGQWISGVYTFTCASCPGAEVVLWRTDGSGGARPTAEGGSVAWAGDGHLAYSATWYDCCPQNSYIVTMRPDGSDQRTVLTTNIMSTESLGSPDWSPASDRLVFIKTFGPYTSAEIGIVNADGTGFQLLTNNSAPDSAASWSPDGSKIVFETQTATGGAEIYTMNPDGSDKTNLTNSPAIDVNPIWSPDGKKIAFESSRDEGYTDIYVMNRDGSGLVRVTHTRGTGVNVYLHDWQALTTGYARPKGAASEWISLVPAYKPCTAPNSTHGTPLAAPSCDPPVPVSDHLTVGTADSNGRPTKATSQLLVEVQVGNAATPEDEADAKLTFFAKDVRNKSDLSDYTGELQGRQSLRLTDKANGYGGASATAQDLAYSFTVPCAATTDTTIGSECNLATTADTLVPGTVKEGKRAIWELGQLQVFDGGSDGLASTSAGNTLFEVQGIFVP